jgi:hypothetical protein
LSPGKEPDRINLFDPVNRILVDRDRNTGNVISVMRVREYAKCAMAETLVSVLCD